MRCVMNSDLSARGPASLGLAILILLLAFGGAPALAQSQTSQTPAILRVGDPCKSRTDPRPGVIKVDACGRWYCGRAEVKDIIELRPNIAAERGCEWQLDGNRCRCIRSNLPELQKPR
jgi:hypothetical protein